MKNATDSPLVLGIDVGTTGTKCTIYDLSGQPVASAYREYAMIHPREGWVEEDPNLWWQAAAENTRLCIERDGIDPARIAGVGVSCTNSFIPLDADGTVLYNAILQLDQRAAAEVDWIAEHIGAERIFAVTGNRIARGTFALPTLLWYLKHRPDILEKTHKFVVPSGFIIQRLTGEFSINTSRMGFTLLSDIRTGTWDEALVRDVGVPMDILATPHQASEIVGEVTRRAAEATGLRPGTPVIAGAMDTVAAAVGAGAVEAGSTFLAIGTCGRSCFSTDRPQFDDRLMNCRHAIEGQWLNVQATNAAGASLRWFRDVFGDAFAGPARETGASVYDAFNAKVEATPAGANGLIYLPYLAGERCPIWDPDARGVFFGLSFSTDFGDMVRAVMEGVAFSIRQGQEIALAHAPRPESLSLGGGIANSRVWCQIFADVLGYPIQRLRVNETETLGSALLAAKGVGLLDDISDVAKATVRNCEVLTPRPAEAAYYSEAFALYEQLYTDLKSDFATLGRLKQGARRT